MDQLKSLEIARNYAKAKSLDKAFENYPHKAIQVMDLSDYPIEITDLNEAIRITSQYMEYKHVRKCFSDFDKKRKAYWRDMYVKLMRLYQLRNNPKK
jgi:hypothetical protein